MTLESLIQQSILETNRSRSDIHASIMVRLLLLAQLVSLSP